MFQPTTKEKGFNKLLLIGAIAAILLFVGAIVAAAYFFKEYKDLKNDSGVAAQSEQKRIIDKVSKLYNTPSEEPSIIQVEDTSKLASQSFFKEAETDDYVLVYQEAKLAILYRETTNKIVNTGPIVLSDDEQKAGPGSGAKSTPPPVADDTGAQSDTNAGQ